MSTEASLERSQHLFPSPAEKSTLGMGYVARPEMLKAKTRSMYVGRAGRRGTHCER